MMKPAAIAVVSTGTVRKSAKPSQPIGGSRKGIPNKTTALARTAIAEFVDGNAHRLVGWLDEIAKEDPKAAFGCFMDVVEYHVPKLARTEIEHGISEGLAGLLKEIDP